MTNDRSPLGFAIVGCGGAARDIARGIDLAEGAHLVAVHDREPSHAAALAAGRLAETGFAAAFHAAPMASTGRFDLGRIDGEDPRFIELVRGAAA